MSEFNKTVGSRIRKCRTEMGLTMKELGDRVNLSEGNIHNYSYNIYLGNSYLHPLQTLHSKKRRELTLFLKVGSFFIL